MSDEKHQLFPESEDELAYLRTRAAEAQAGARAKNVMASPDWSWVEDVVLGSIHDEAVETLAKATSDADRLKAQMMLLAARKPKQILNRLAREGEAAAKQISEISTQPKEGEKS